MVLARRKAGVRATPQVVSQLGQKAREEVGQSMVTAGQVDFGLGSGLGEKALERSQRRPPRFVADGGGVHTESQFSGRVGGDDRRPRIGSVQGDDRIIASVDGGNDGVGGAEVDADSHRAIL